MPAHNHVHAEVGLAEADAHCARRGVKLDGLRRRILEALAASGKALGAYDLIESAAAPGQKRPAPAQVYRALDFLISQGLAHRIESKNAFTACPHHHGASETVVFFVCDACGRVQEAASEAMKASLAALARKQGFRPQSNIIEVGGRCAACSESVMTA